MSVVGIRRDRGRVAMAVLSGDGPGPPGPPWLLRPGDIVDLEQPGTSSNPVVADDHRSHDGGGAARRPREGA